MLVILTVVIACAATACTPATALDFALAQPPRVVIQPSNGATAVNPLDQAWVAVTGGVFDAVRLTNPAGNAVTGHFSAATVSPCRSH
jgi:hypothetical protein